MNEMLDIHDLPKEQVKIIKEFVAFLRARGKRKEEKINKKEKVTFKSWPLGIKGKLTRGEIYDYL